MIFTRKINRIPEFYMIIGRKIYSRFFFWGGGNGPSLPPPPSVSYACEVLWSSICDCRYVNLTLFTFLPLTLLVVFNSLLVSAVRTAARRRHRMSVGEYNVAESNSRIDRHLQGQQRITVRSLSDLLHRGGGRHAVFWVDQICCPPPTFYKRSMQRWTSYLVGPRLHTFHGPLPPSHHLCSFIPLSLFPLYLPLPPLRSRPLKYS